ncbi:FAD-binding and (Fe-S)-binding domain-containing protein [Hydrogenovibrio kuenenii]|uniref:FAD-binding and (Fe-S)-binding domain-containing protein n=1 Tax=Hydrogenovibrio kuenenii TaxID=63658 RepID=UPI000464692E|nr:FAD-binding and (Fe-S)-binding domain-containing protein [Hydrogenovibrio kuenenii]
MPSQKNTAAKLVTDASVFEFPLTKWLSPKSLPELVHACRQAFSSNQSMTMRAGGTSLGGQAIGSEVLIDVSKHLTQILDYRPERKEIVVEPGVIQDDLNAFVKADGLRFAPDTSTSNRAMIGGMIGNNSCGSYSIFYGTTREHVKSVEVILSDGTETVFEDLPLEELAHKQTLDNLEGEIYRGVVSMLEDHGDAILENFPDASIKRRNTGYALDELYRHHQPFNPQGKPFNLTPLICGSEGTLAVVKSARLGLVEAPKYRQLICAHYHSVQEALQVVPEFLQFHPAAIELIDRPTLEGTLDNKALQSNRFWIQDDPAAVLVVELFDDSHESLIARLRICQAWLADKGAYAAPVIDADDSDKVWSIRKAGLGLLMGKVTRQKAVAVIEDASVPVNKLPDYYRDVELMMADLGVSCIYYGHASVGLIHIRPELDLATEKGKQLFQEIAVRNAKLVKTYRGAISGEHGDGRIRAPYIKEQVGETVYQCLVDLKHLFDPNNLLNPGVIIGDMPITQNLRADRQPQQQLLTGFDWSKDLSLMDAVEKCNGAAACRKSTGTMCPSYQATREENYSTRGRSNLLRFALTEPNPTEALSNQELQDALEMCLGCKACHSECPANVDMARLKAEVLYQTGKASLSRFALKHYGRLMQLGSLLPSFYNRIQRFGWLKRSMNVDIRRQLPKLSSMELGRWYKTLNPSQGNKQRIWLLCDVYSRYQEAEVGQAAILTLQKLGCDVQPIFLDASPRALISQGLLDEARQALTKIQRQLAQISENDWVVGIEPSEVLVWRDEAPALLKGATPAWQILLFEEAILKLGEKMELPFHSLTEKVKVHTHCHQKSLAKEADVAKALQLIPGLEVERIASGCCGMSGEFGYRHYDVSKKIAEQGLLPAVEMQDDALIVATGTSCRHQLDDFSTKQSLHSAQVFLKALS